MGLKTRVSDLFRETIVISSTTFGVMEIFTSKELKFYLEHDRSHAVLIGAIFKNPNSNFPSTFIKEHKNNSITVPTIDLIREYDKYQ